MNFLGVMACAGAKTNASGQRKGSVDLVPAVSQCRSLEVKKEDRDNQNLDGPRSRSFLALSEVKVKQFLTLLLSDLV